MYVYIIIIIVTVLRLVHICITVFCVLIVHTSVACKHEFVQQLLCPCFVLYCMGIEKRGARRGDTKKGAFKEHESETKKGKTLVNAKDVAKKLDRSKERDAHTQLSERVCICVTAWQCKSRAVLAPSFIHCMITSVYCVTVVPVPCFCQPTRTNLQTSCCFCHQAIPARFHFLQRADQAT